ncbi:MAG: amidophosphoribosyltransferase, partial [bacterium]
NPCFYGIDTPTHQELIASSHEVEEIRDYITADSLGYLSMDGLHKALGWETPEGVHEFCDACFSGDYPVAFPREEDDTQMTLWAPRIKNV